MIGLWLIEWTAAAFVVLGYERFNRGDTLAGAICTMAGAGLLCVWAPITGSWGVLALNAAVIYVNGRAILKMWRREE